MKGLFVTGTDTGVGKTAVTCALVRALRGLGLEVGAMKPVESGCAELHGALVPEDGLALQAAAGGGDPLELVTPYRLRAPLAPGLAAAAEGVDVSFDRIEAALGQLCVRHPDGVLVEGAGGLLVPLEPGLQSVADLAVRLGLPVLVVARPGLGTVNHTALTIEALSLRGLACVGVLLNDAMGAQDPSVATNARTIERVADVPVIATLPHLPGAPFQARVEAHAALLRGVLGPGGKMDPMGWLS